LISLGQDGMLKGGVWFLKGDPYMITTNQEEKDKPPTKHFASHFTFLLCGTLFLFSGEAIPPLPLPCKGV